MIAKFNENLKNKTTDRKNVETTGNKKVDLKRFFFHKDDCAPVDLVRINNIK
jgi:hypothetical protein